VLRIATLFTLFVLLWNGGSWAITGSGERQDISPAHWDSLFTGEPEGSLPQVAVTVVHSGQRPEIVIRAWFYAAHNRPEEHAQIAEAVEFWNQQSGRFVYRLGKGQAAVDYRIRFELAAAPGTYDTGGFFIPQLNVDARLLNQVQVVSDQDMARLSSRREGAKVVGYAPSNLIYIADSHSDNLDIGIHEAGHRLGAAHAAGAMACDLHRVSDGITRHTVKDILATAGILGQGWGHTHRLAQFRERPYHIGEPPVDFSRKGKVTRAHSR